MKSTTLRADNIILNTNSTNYLTVVLSQQMTLIKAIIISFLINCGIAFNAPRPHNIVSKRISTNLSSAQDATSSTSLTTNPDVKPSDEWELDCYSRPVMVGGKKLWEVLITDSNGSFRLCETLPSNK